ncbi:MAG TPA: hypothetical protein VLR90_08220, partial [Blastocatellia bacterium]|nr:hypothetical protein [Blastocatellia bacterium]
YSGSLEEIAAGESERMHIEPPAIAIVGDVVSLKDKLRWFGNPALEYSLEALACEGLIGGIK